MVIRIKLDYLLFGPFGIIPDLGMLRSGLYKRLLFFDFRESNQ